MHGPLSTANTALCYVQESQQSPRTSSASSQQHCQTENTVCRYNAASFRSLLITLRCGWNVCISCNPHSRNPHYPIHAHIHHRQTTLTDAVKLINSGILTLQRRQRNWSLCNASAHWLQQNLCIVRQHKRYISATCITRYR